MLVPHLTNYVSFLYPTSCFCCYFFLSKEQTQLFQENDIIHFENSELSTTLFLIKININESKITYKRWHFTKNTLINLTL